MSADAFVVYYGIRLSMPEIDTPEFELYEEDSNPRQLAARSAGPDTWWGQFFDNDDLVYYLFIGHQIGIFGGEFENERSVGDAELQRIRTETRTKLKAASFIEEPALWSQFQPDT